jgi:conjugal transfer/entry exclusion protein
MKRILRFLARALVVVLLIASVVFIGVGVRAGIPVTDVGNMVSHTTTSSSSISNLITTLQSYWQQIDQYYEQIEQTLRLKQIFSTAKETTDTINKYYDFYKSVNDKIDNYKNYNLDKLQRDVSYKLDRRYPEVRYVKQDSQYITDGKKKSRSMSDSRMKEVVFDAFGTIDKTATAAEASTKIIATNSIIEASNSEEYLKELKESVEDYNSDVASENSPGKAQQLTAQAVGMSNAIAVENLALDADRNRLIATDLLNKTKKDEAGTKMNTYVYTSIANNPTGLKKDDLKWRQ